jgi:hypothetical protein
MARRLDLTDEQAENIRDIIQEARMEGRGAGQKLAEAKRALNDAVADGAGEEKIREAADVLAKAIGDQAVHQSQTRTAIREVLTDEQRERLEQAKERFGGRPPAWRPPERPQGGRGSRGPGWGGQRGRAWQSNAGPGGPRGMRGPGRQRMERPGRQSQQGSRMGRGGRGPWSDRQGRGGVGGPMGGRSGQGRGPQFPERMFERADANNDGVLSKEELETFRQKRPTRPESRPW